MVWSGFAVTEEGATSQGTSMSLDGWQGPKELLSEGGVSLCRDRITSYIFTKSRCCLGASPSITPWQPKPFHSSQASPRLWVPITLCLVQNILSWRKMCIISKGNQGHEEQLGVVN